ncbi:hypothetical protein [Devosia submarina]|uniref:hypothetical protein n=1 Tax=Devosia submarina TaxID=1173082 RepID=UPI00130035C4|nr:hypothetical protein [Devosia submarina]
MTDHFFPSLRLVSPPPHNFIATPRTAGNGNAFIQREEPVATHRKHVKQIASPHPLSNGLGTDKDQLALDRSRQLTTRADWTLRPAKTAPDIAGPDVNSLKLFHYPVLPPFAGYLWNI